MRLWLLRKIRPVAFPMYDCELCVGQDPGQGCWCAYHGGIAPGVGPEWWRSKLQRFVLWLQRTH